MRPHCRTDVLHGDNSTNYLGSNVPRPLLYWDHWRLRELARKSSIRFRSHETEQQTTRKRGGLRGLVVDVAELL